MQQIDVDSLKFTFPEQWIVTKYDDWDFFKKQFAKLHASIKGIDIIAIDSKEIVWLIEAKDYRLHRRNKGIPFAEEVGQKVLGTLAALFPAKVNAASHDESDFAAKALSAKRLRVVFHCEQPAVHSKMFPHVIDHANEQKKFKSKFKAIDPRPLVVSKTRMPQWIEWSVQ